MATSFGFSAPQQTQTNEDVPSSEISIDRTVKDPAVKKTIPIGPGINASTKGSDETEQGVYTKFLNPMLDDMEAAVSKNNAILDKISADMEADRKIRFKKILQSHIPEELQGSGKTETEVMDLVEQLIFYEEVEEEDDGAEDVGDGDGPSHNVQLNESAHLQELDEASKLTVSAHSLVAHFSTLQPSILEKAANKVQSDCQLWLSRLFRFKDSSTVYHDKANDGLVQVAKLALHTHYPKYATEGFEALYSRPPVFYISSSANPNLGKYICQQLGLPMSCASTVPCNTLFGATSKMDVAMLEKLIQDDIAAAKTPVLLIGFAGTPVVGHVDNLPRLQEICKTNNIWLHVEGHYLATLSLFSVPTSIEQALSADSLTLDLTRWLGIPSLPYITLYKETDSALKEVAGLSMNSPHVKLRCLPLWMCLQCLGHEGMVSKVKHSCELAKTLFEQLDQLSTIKQISREKKKKQDKEIRSVKDLINKAINALLVFEIMSPTVVFKYTEDVTGPGAVVASYSGIKADDENQDKDLAYFNALNTWLAETLQDSCPRIPIDLVEVEREGVCIRYSPLETAQVRGTIQDDVNHFVECLKSNLSVLNATTVERKKFQTVVCSHQNLRLVDLHSWAGLGAVSYIPESYASQESELTDKDKIEINNLNAELVHKLKAQDTAFSAGHTEEGMMCVRFGLITEDTDVEELVSLVYSTGREVEESSKFLETMSEMIKKGITEANKELEKESEVKLMQEGVLRQVPVVSSFLNWFSPSKEEIKGRTFNLSSGKIVPTTDIYKYHMQVKSEGDTEAADQIAHNHAAPPSGSSRTHSVSSDHSSTTAGQVKAHLASEVSTASEATSLIADVSQTETPSGS